MATYQAVLFDMDGLIFNSERIGYEAYLRAARKFGFQINPYFYMSQCGKNEAGVIEGIRACYGADKDVVTWRKFIRHEKDVVREEHHGKAGKKKGLLELLSYLQERGIPYALASASDRKMINDCLAGEYLTHAFAHIMDGSQVERCKPDPEIFLRACELIGQEPAHTLVLEDSRAGIRAANAGGFTSGFIFDDLTDMPTVTEGYPMLKTYPGPEGIRDEADYTFDDLSCVIDFLERDRKGEPLPAKSKKTEN